MNYAFFGILWDNEYGPQTMALMDVLMKFQVT